MMLFTRQLLLVLLPQVFCSAAATDDSSPPIRKRTQRVHSASDSTAAHLRGGSRRDTDNFDPYIGVERELTADDLTMSAPTGHSMSLSMSMSVSITSTLTQTLSSTPTPAPVIVDLGYEPCDDPDQVPLEVIIITDAYAVVDETSYTLTSHPDDGPVETYMERTKMDNVATYNDSICVPKGRYLFTLNDKFNGLVSSGRKGDYSVKSKGTEILNGASFPAPSISYTILAGMEPNMSDEDRQWLDGHNSRRKKFHEENEKDFKPLVWSESLVKSAADYAAMITPTCEVLQKADPWGHTVAIAPLFAVNEKQNVPDDVLRRMFDRKLMSVYPDNKSLTQIAWRASRYVGCFSLIEQSTTGIYSGAYCHVSVCKYARPGNCSVSPDNWLEKTLADRSNCGQVCPDEGCA
ncbi:hypothetical protein ACHAWT_005829 [Skeletonema menzelii]